MNPVLSIDVSKSTSFAAAFLSNSKPYSKPFKFSHSPTDFSNLLSILSEMESLSGLAPSVVLEATGNYSKPISTYFINHGYDVVVLNPLQTHELKKKRDFYDKKIAEGKPSKVAIVATSNKLLRIIYGVLKNGKPFELR